MAARTTRVLVAPLAALAASNPALSVTALAVTGRAGVLLAAASAAPGAGFASRGIVKRTSLPGSRVQEGSEPPFTDSLVEGTRLRTLESGSETPEPPMAGERLELMAATPGTGGPRR